MALQRSTELHETSYDNPQLDGSEIEMSHIEGNIYDSLENRDRVSHVYSTTRDAVPAAKTRTNYIDSKAQPNGIAKRVTLSRMKVELPICQVAIAILLVCTLICTISGFIVYTVINAKISEIEQHTSQNYRAVQAVQGTLETVQKHQNTSDIASLDYQANNDRRLATLDNVVETVQETVQTVQKHQNASETASIDYNDNNDRRLATLDKEMQTVQERQNISGHQVAFTATGASGNTVNTVLTFTYVLLNVGIAYNKTTGRFRCPVAGTYLFSATLLSVSTRSSYTHCSIRKNAVRIALVYSQEGVHDSASMSVLLHLSVGDLVDLGSCHNVHYLNTPYGETSFIGSLIQAD